jgi:hypothetical protein
LAESFSENNLKGDLPNVATFNPPLFSLDNTFKLPFHLFVCLAFILTLFYFFYFSVLSFHL